MAFSSRGLTAVGAKERNAKGVGAALLSLPVAFDDDAASAEDLKSHAEFAARIGREGERRFERARVRDRHQTEPTKPGGQQQCFSSPPIHILPSPSIARPRYGLKESGTRLEPSRAFARRSTDTWE